MPGEANASHREAQPLRQLHPQHRQGDGDTTARAHQHLHEAVVRVVVIVDVAAEVQILKKELIENAQLLQRAGIHRNAALDAGQKLVRIIQYRLDIQVRVFVLCQADCGFKQSKVGVALYQSGKVVQRGWWCIRQLHTEPRRLNLSTKKLSQVQPGSPNRAQIHRRRAGH